MNWAFAVGQHGEGELRRAARKIQGHHTAIVGANRIGPGEGLGGPSAPTALVSSWPLVRLPTPSAVNLPTAAKNRGDASIPGDPAEGKCVVAIQLGVVVHCGIGRALALTRRGRALA